MQVKNHGMANQNFRINSSFFNDMKSKKSSAENIFLKKTDSNIMNRSQSMKKMNSLIESLNDNIDLQVDDKTLELFDKTERMSRINFDFDYNSGDTNYIQKNIDKLNSIYENERNSILEKYGEDKDMLAHLDKEYDTQITKLADMASGYIKAQAGLTAFRIKIMECDMKILNDPNNKSTPEQLGLSLSYRRAARVGTSMDEKKMFEILNVVGDKIKDSILNYGKCSKSYINSGKSLADKEEFNSYISKNHKGYSLDNIDSASQAVSYFNKKEGFESSNLSYNNSSDFTKEEKDMLNSIHDFYSFLKNVK